MAAEDRGAGGAMVTMKLSQAGKCREVPVSR